MNVPPFLHGNEVVLLRDGSDRGKQLGRPGEVHRQGEEMLGFRRPPFAPVLLGRSEPRADADLTREPKEDTGGLPIEVDDEGEPAGTE